MTQMDAEATATNNDAAMREALAASVADEPATKAIASDRSVGHPSSRSVVSRPMSAWRAAYIAKHHHQPPVKSK
jgi:hypothetical protein